MIQFVYTKPNGEVSDRLGIILNTPSDLYQILDLSDLDEDEIELVQQQASAYLKERGELYKKHKLNAYIKNFKASNMTEVILDV